MRRLMLVVVIAVLILSAVPASHAQDGGVIRGWIFEDLNNNGDRDVGEAGVTPSTVCLIKHDPLWCDHTEWGEFEFDLLEPGTYHLKLVEYPDGYHPRTRRMVVVRLGADEIARVDFAVVAIPGQAGQ